MGIGYAGAYAAPRADLGEAFSEYEFSVQNFIGLQLFTPLSVARKEASFARLTRENYLRNENLARAAGAAYSRGQFEAEDQTYRCEERGFEHPLDDSERALYANDFDSEMAAAKLAWAKLMIAHERAVRDELTDASFTVLLGTRTDVAISWALPQADVITDVRTAVEAVRGRTGVKPNAFWMSEATRNALISNQGLRDALQHAGMVPTVDAMQNMLAALFGLQVVLVGGQVENTANEGQAAVIRDIWVDPGAVVGGEAGQRRAGVCVVAPAGAGLQAPCAGRTLIWNEDAPSMVQVEEYREEQVRSTIYRARHHLDELTIDANFAQLLDIAG